MKNLSECKAEIRRQMLEKEKRRSALHKRWIISLSTCTTVLFFICLTMAISNTINSKKTIYIPNQNVEKYDSFEKMIHDCDLIFIGTVQSERFVLENPSAPETVKTEYGFEIERCIMGDFDHSTIVVTTEGGTVNNVTYVLKGRENYVLGEKYIVFLSKPTSESIMATSLDLYVETSPIVRKIRIKEGEIDTNAEEWQNVDDISSIKTIDELIYFIQRINNKK